MDTGRVYLGRAHVSAERASDGGSLWPHHPGGLVQPERAEGPGDHRAAGLRRPARLQGRAPVQLQGRQAGGCAGGADPSELTMSDDRDRIAEFKEVADLMPDDPVVRFGLAGAYLDAGQAESAIIEYQETIRLKPDYSAAHRGLGRALERAGRREAALAAYRKGLEVATQTGDLQTKKEIEVFLRRLDPPGS